MVSKVIGKVWHRQRK